MSRIITIGREFGSGGREIGKRIAEGLGIAYYDKEILTEISKRTELAENYVRQVLEQRPITYYPITTGHSFYVDLDPGVKFANSIYVEQNNVIRDLASRSDCVIVGRCADYILRDMNPLRLFICGDMQHKMARCREKSEVDICNKESIIHVKAGIKPAKTIVKGSVSYEKDPVCCTGSDAACIHVLLRDG